MATRYYLTLFGDDDVTVAAECSTDPGHAKPYLMLPDGFAESEIDLLHGRSVIGQLNIGVLDKRSDPADQASGWLTALLADAKGESARIGRRALLEELPPGESTRVTVLDGVIGAVRQGEDLVTYTLEIRDAREREREVKAFTRTNTPTVLPGGVFDGYGRQQLVLFGIAFPITTHFIPPPRPIRGTYRASGSTDAFGPKPDGSVLLRYSHWDWRDPDDWSRNQLTDPAALLGEAQIELLKRREFVRSEPYSYFDESGTQREGEASFYRAMDMELYWRAAGTSDPWTIIRDGIYPGTMFQAVSGSYQGREVRGAWQVFFSSENAESAPVPLDGQEIEFLIRYDGAVSEDWPAHITGTAGELLRDLYDGVYSEYAPRIRYDAAAVLALTEPVRARITEPVDDLRKWVEEHLYKPLGAAPALNAAGEIAPIRYALPDASVSLTEINDSNTAPDAGWAHSAEDAINRVRFIYLREFRAEPGEAGPNTPRAVDGIQTRPVEVEEIAVDSVALLGEQELEYEPLTIRSVGGTEGEPLSGDVTDEAGHRLARARARQAIDRFRFGGQHIRATCRRSQVGNLKVGDWVLVALSWLPDYQTGRKGSNRLAQVVAIRDRNAAWRELRLVDAGPDNQPLGQPTLGTLTANDAGVVTVPVDAVPTGGEARVDYAVSDTLPDTGSGLWTFAGRRASIGEIRTPPLPAGATVWIRARGEAEGRRPSAWTNADSMVLPQIPRVTRVRVGVDADGVATVIWEPSPYMAGARIFYDAHPAGDEPAYASSIDRDAADRSATLPGTFDPDQVLSVAVEPWSGWDGSAVTGIAGPRVEANTIAPPILFHLVRTRVAVRESGGTGTVILSLAGLLHFVTDVAFYATAGTGARTGPHPATREPEPGRVYEYDIALHPEHNVYIEPVVTLRGGQTIEPGAETFDRDKSANLIGRPAVSYDGDQATVSVTADTDTVKLYHEEYTADAWGSRTQFASGRRGSFTVTASPDVKRRFRVAGENAAGQLGEWEEVEINRRGGTPKVISGSVGLAVAPDGSAVLRVHKRGVTASFAYKWSTTDYPEDDPTGATVVNFSDLFRIALRSLTTIDPGQTIYARVWFYDGLDGTGERGETAVAERQRPSSDAVHDPDTGRIKPEIPFNPHPQFPGIEIRRPGDTDHDAQSKGQNLLGPDAGDEVTWSSTLEDGQNVSLSEARLAVGNVVSASAEMAEVGGGETPRLRVSFLRTDGSGIAAHEGNIVSGLAWQLSHVDNLTIPADTATIWLRGVDGQSLGGKIRRRMLNRGPAALPFEEPPFRAQRERADWLRYLDGASVEGLKPAEAGAEVTQGKSLTVFVDRTLDHIGDTTTWRRCGSGYVDNSGRPYRLWDADVGTIRDGSYLGSGASRAHSGLNSSGRVISGVEATADIDGRAASLVRGDAQVGRKWAGVEPVNLILNGGGQEGEENGRAAQWTYGAGEPLRAPGSSAAKYGDRILFCRHNSAANSYSFQEIAVKAGEVYEASAWIRTSALSGDGQGALLYLYSAGGLEALERTTVGSWAEGSTYKMVGLPADGVARDMTFVRLLVRTSADSTLRMNLILGNGGTVAGDAYFDGVRLVKREDGVRRTYAALDGNARLTDQRRINTVMAANLSSRQSGLTISAVWDSGANAHKITASAHSVKYGGFTVSYHEAYAYGASNTTYYLYYDDPDYTGGTQSLLRTDNIVDIVRDGRYAVGKVTTGSDGSSSDGSGGGTTLI